jgi:hypothetical protein
MSMETIAHVYAHSKIRNPAARAVLVAIAYHTNQQTGLAHPSLPRLAVETCLTIRGVRKAVKLIEQWDEMEVSPSRGRGHGKVYRITLKGEPSSSFSERKGEPSSSFPARKRGTTCHKKGERGSPQPNTEPKEKKEAAFSLTHKERLARAHRLGITPGSAGWRDYVDG